MNENRNNLPMNPAQLRQRERLEQKNKAAEKMQRQQEVLERENPSWKHWKTFFQTGRMCRARRAFPLSALIVSWCRPKSSMPREECL